MKHTLSIEPVLIQIYVDWSLKHTLSIELLIFIAYISVFTLEDI